MYCASKTQAAIEYKFAGSQSKTYIVRSPNLPVSVEVTGGGVGSVASQSFNQSYPGQVPTTYNFKIDAPSNVPFNLPSPPGIYLISGIWDDYGSIGNYNTGYGIVRSYSGTPLLIGNGYSINGAVVNVMPVDCYARLSLEWRWQGCKISISSNGQQIYQDSGSCPCTYQVSCDDDCPQGYCKIDCEAYPGYCCLNEAQLQSLSNQLNS